MSQLTPDTRREHARAISAKRAMRPVGPLILAGFVALVTPFIWPGSSAIEMAAVVICWGSAAALIRLSRRLATA